MSKLPKRVINLDAEQAYYKRSECLSRTHRQTDKQNLKIRNKRCTCVKRLQTKLRWHRPSRKTSLIRRSFVNEARAYCKDSSIGLSGGRVCIHVDLSG